MKHLIEIVHNSWTWNHKLLLLTLALFVALLLESNTIVLPTFASEVTYSNPVIEDNSLKAQIERRTTELYNQNRAMDLEKYRQEALREVNLQLQDMVNDSPFVDYEALKEKHGY